MKLQEKQKLKWKKKKLKKLKWYDWTSSKNTEKKKGAHYFIGQTHTMEKASIGGARPRHSTAIANAYKNA